MAIQPQWPDVTIGSLTDRDAVLAAMQEFDRLGREAFLQAHRFGHARYFYVRHDGRLYDSKAIAGVALGYQHGPANELRAGYFKGGEQTVARVLRRLDFEVIDTRHEGAATLAPLRPGTTYTWDDLAATFGFQPRYFAVGGGMLATKKHNALLLITHRRGDTTSIYHDQWDDETGDLIYTGKGLSGPQQLDRENLDVAENRRTLYLFEQAGSSQLLFHGIGRCTDWWPDVAPDRAGHQRRVYRFRLQLDSERRRGLPARDATSAIAASQLRRPRPFDGSKPPSKYRLSEGAKASPEETAALQEKALVGHHAILVALSAALDAAGFTAIEEIPGATDLQARKRGGRVLFEAKTLSPKSESARVRGGFAQLLEYRFLHGSPEDHLCLVGNAPIADRRVRLLRALAIDFIWLDDRRFRSPTAPLSPRIEDLISS